MTKARDLHRRWMTNDSYRAEYDDLENEFASAKAVIEARQRKSRPSVPAKDDR